MFILRMPGMQKGAKNEPEGKRYSNCPDVAEDLVAAGVGLTGNQDWIGEIGGAGLPGEGEQDSGHGGVGKKNSKRDYSDYRK